MYDARQYLKNQRLYIIQFFSSLLCFIINYLYREFPPGHEAVESYMNRRDVRIALHATESPQPFVECADPPYNALSHQDGKGVTNELAYILESGMRLLVYSGNFVSVFNQ